MGQSNFASTIILSLTQFITTKDNDWLELNAVNVNRKKIVICLQITSCGSIILWLDELYNNSSFQTISV